MAAGMGGGQPVLPSGPGRATARLGVFRVGHDRMAAVYLDTATGEDQREFARLVLAAQNGACSFAKSAPNCFMGDTAVRVTLRSHPADPDLLILDVSAKLRPEHLTYAFVARAPVPRRDAEAFWATFRRSRDYVLTVALRGQLDLERVYVVKYYVETAVPLG